MIMILIAMLLVQLDGSAAYLAFSDDGDTLIAVGNDVTLWDTETQEPQTFSYMDAVFYTRKGDLRITGDTDGVITAWDDSDVPTNSVETELAGDFVPTYAAGDGVVAAGGCLQPEPDGSCAVGLVQVYDVETLELAYELSGPLELITGIAIDGDRLAIVTRDGALWVWDTATLEVLNQSDAGQTEITDVAFYQQEVIASLCTAADENGCVESEITFRGIENGETTRTLTVPGAVNSFDRAGEQLAAASDDGMLRVFDVAGGSVLYETAFAADVVRFAPDGVRIAAASDEAIVIWEPGAE
ncbi:MAG: hypothetical protein AAF787_14980 [Chloroflexota bacterium]